MRIKKVKFPQNIKPHRYYLWHAMYLRNALEAAGVQIELVDDTTVYSGFTIDIDGTVVFIDYSDHLEFFKNSKQYEVYFKFHYTEQHKAIKNMYPIAPISFYDWQEFYNLRKKIKYGTKGNTILNIQTPRRSEKRYGCYERRSRVQFLLKKKYSSNAVLRREKNQVDFWRRINNCLVSVCIPGARLDILDRGHLQYMAFGCCIIAPPIADLFPYYRKLEPDIHYIQMKSDYSDMIDKIEWCKRNRQKCVEIGQNARKLFNETCTPIFLKTWIEECMEKSC